MSLTRVNPTRMELTRLKRQLATAKRGHKLLKDKQDEMVRQFMLIIKKTKALREEVEEQLSKIIKSFSSAQLKTSKESIYESLMVPAKALEIEVGINNIMNIKTPTINFVDTGKISLTYGFAFTPSELDGSILALSELLPKFIELAGFDKACDMLASEIEKTRRRVNAIEHIRLPNLEENIKRIVMKLDDIERFNTVRMIKSKEITTKKNK